MDFNKILQIDLGTYQRPIPLINSFGPMFPVLADEILSQVLEIADHEHVLDIGGGANPFSRANVVTEPFLKNAVHRSGLPVQEGIKYVECVAEKLPFGDKQFDFAISRQVFEHVNSPLAACKEISRVAKRGFIETPNKQFELIFGPNPSHNWFVSIKEGALIFERRKFIRHFFRNPGLSAVLSSQEGQMLAHWEFKNLSNTQFYWEDSFRCEVIDSEHGFNYANPEHAAQAHLDVAICGVLHGGFYLNHRESDAREAVRLKPQWALAKNTLGIILWKLGRRKEAIQEFKEAYRLENKEEFADNAALDISQEQPPIVVDFYDTLEMDQRFFSTYTKPTNIDIFSLLK